MSAANLSQFATPITTGLQPVADRPLSRERATELAAQLRALAEHRRAAWAEIRSQGRSDA